MPLQIIQKQAMMRKVIYSLTPLFIFAFILYGFNLLILAAVVFISGFFTEFIMEKLKGKKVTEAVFVTCMLYLLSLPSETPWWIAVIGIVFGVLFGKEVFGGFGKNVFNPAIAGRLFVYITFPNEMKNFGNVTGIAQNFDAITSATPLGLLRNGEVFNINGILKLLFGLHLSSMGEGCIILIIIAGVYLIITKTASKEIMISMIASSLIIAFLLDFFNVPKALPALPSLLSGSILFVAVFMATDPVSAPKRIISKWVYGIIIGSVAVIIRTFSLFPEGTSFGVLIGNMFGPLLDEVIPKKQTPKKVPERKK